MAGFTLVTTQTIIARNAGALYGLEVGASNMTSYVTAAGSNVDAFLNAAYTASVGSTSTSTVADVLIANLGITGDAAAAAKSYIVGQLNGVAVSARGAAINGMLTAFAGMTGDATFGAAATAWNTKVTNAVNYAAVSGNNDTAFDNVSSTPVGQTFTLTSSLDVINGGSGADTINAVLQGAAASGTTVAPGDVINGGAGVDTLNISVAGSAGGAYTLSAVQTNAVEKILLSQFDTDSVNVTTVAADLMNGVTTVGFTASGADGDTTFTGLKNAVGAEMRNGAADLTLSYVSTVLAGAADTQTLTVSGDTGGTFTADGAETIAITSELAASKITNVSSNTLKAVTVAGSADLTITTALTAATIDANAATGAVNVTLGSATQKVTGGSGNDVVDANTNLSSADTVAGGAGNDTLKLSVGNATVAVGTTASKGALFNVTGFEVIDIASTDDNAALDLDTTTGVTTVVAAANVKTVTFTGDATNTAAEAIAFTLNGVAYTTASVDFTGNAASDVSAANTALKNKINTISGFTATAGTTGAVTITSTTGEAIELAITAGTADALDLEVTEFSDAGVTTESLNFDAAGVETLNLSMKNTNAGKVDLGGVTATTGSTVTVNVSGTGVAELTALSSSITNVVSTGTGALTIAAADRTASAMTITGGEGADSIALKNASDVLNGGLGTDTLNVSFGAILGGIEVNLGATDQVVSLNGSANAAVQTGFENVDLSAFTGFGAVVTGSTGANSIVGTALADQITGGNGADVITGGAGNDVIDLTETTAASDTVVFSAVASNGTDTISGFAAGASKDILKVTGLATLTDTLGDTVQVATAATTSATAVGTAKAWIVTDAAAADWSDVAAKFGAAMDESGAGSEKSAFLISNGTDTRVYLYQNDGANNAVQAAELTLVGTVSGVLASALDVSNVVVV